MFNLTKKTNSTDPVKIYIDQIDKLLPYSKLSKAPILKELGLDVAEAVADANQKNPSLVFGLPREVAKNISISQDWNTTEAGFRIRLLAYVIDLLVSIGAVTLILMLPVLFIILNQDTLDSTTIIIALILFISVLPFVFAIVAGYPIILEGLFSTTIGKRVFNLWVVDYSGIKITWQQALIRSLSKLQSTVLIVDVLIGRYQGFRNQRALDRLAETYVIKINE